MNKLETIKVFTKSNFKTIATDIVAMVENGEQNALELDLKLKSIEETVKLARESIQSNVLQEVEKNATKESNGVAITLVQGSAKYDFTSSKEWLDLEFKIRDNKESQKDLEEKLILAYKLQQKGSFIGNEETGEIIEAAKVASYSKSFIKYNFK